MTAALTLLVAVTAVCVAGLPAAPLVALWAAWQTAVRSEGFRP